MRISDVGDVGANAMLDARDVKKIAAIFRNKAIDEQKIGAALDQPACQVRADEPECSGDQHPAISECLSESHHDKKLLFYRPPTAASPWSVPDRLESIRIRERH